MMDHVKNPWIKTEETDEVETYASNEKIKEEFQEDTDGEYDEETLSVYKKEEPEYDLNTQDSEDMYDEETFTVYKKEEPEYDLNTQDSEDMYVEDRVGMRLPIYMEEESRRRCGMDDSVHKIPFSADSVDGSCSPKHQSGSQLNHPFWRIRADKKQLFVGNMTWWTTDQEITDAILGIGVTDFIGVKFFENRANGQSKGFCLVTMGSDESLRKCMESLPNKELHGQKLLVKFPTRSALSVLEAQAQKELSPRLCAVANCRVGSRLRGVRALQSVRLLRRLCGHWPDAVEAPQPIWHPHLPPPPPPPPHPAVHYDQWTAPPPNVPPPPPPPPCPSSVVCHQGANHPPPHFYGPPPPPPPPPPPEPQPPPPPASQTQFSVPPPKLHPDGPPPISGAEIQELMARNRSISSSAIARAVSDAAAGQYTRAIETLLTAIWLIKQSKVANDARCEILVSSLQDTLNGIEMQSFESARRGVQFIGYVVERSQSRERERSVRARRERSRSHDRACRGQSLDRESQREHEGAGARERSPTREGEFCGHAHHDRYYNYRYQESEEEDDHEETKYKAELKSERNSDSEIRDG